MFRQIFLEKWVPALITAGVGGMLVALLVPGIQSHYAEQTVLKQRQVEIWESIGENFTDFINAHFQLVTVARHQANLESSGKEAPIRLLERKEGYRELRDASVSKLNRDLILAPFYFGSAVEALVKDYYKWLSQVRIATVEDMPTRAEFEAWRDKFLKTIRTKMDAG